MNDTEIIDALGGPAKVAALLGYEDGGIQRVHNWRLRGIPYRVKVEHPELAKKAAEAKRVAETAKG